MGCGSSASAKPHERDNASSRSDAHTSFSVDEADHMFGRGCAFRDLSPKRVCAAGLAAPAAQSSRSTAEGIHERQRAATHVMAIAAGRYIAAGGGAKSVPIPGLILIDELPRAAVSISLWKAPASITDG